MANAKRTPSGSWRVLIYVGMEDGKRKYKAFTDKDKRTCERKAAEYADKHRGNKRISCTVESAVNIFLESRKSVLSPSTLRGYKSVETVLKTHYKSFYGASAYDLTSDMLQKLINDMIMDGASAKTVKNRIGLITAALSQVGVTAPKVTLPKMERNDPVIATPEMVKEILSLSKEKDNGMYVPIALAAMCGLRRSEIVGLDISDIDQDGIAHIHRATVLDEDLNPVTKNQTKTYESDRYVKIPDEIVQKIKAQGFVCDFDNPERISERFSHLAKKCGYNGLRFHDMRHFWTSHLHSLGISDAVIMKMGGWKTDVMKRVYRHALPDAEKAALELIEESQKSLFA